MDKRKLESIFVDLGISEGLVNLHVVHDAIAEACGVEVNDDDAISDDVAKHIKVINYRTFKVDGITFNVRDDGTLKIERDGVPGYSVTNNLGIEVEMVLEQNDEGERKLVRRNGTIREVFVTDQGEEYVDGQVRLDNGHPFISKAIGKTIRKDDKPVYFNTEEVLRNFDENTEYLQYGSVQDRIYRRELRKKIEERMQDEKVSRLPLPDQVEALKEILSDLEDEYEDLCAFIELDLEEHRNNLDFIGKAMRFPKVKDDFAGRFEDYGRRVAKQKLDLNVKLNPVTRLTEIVVGDVPKKPDDSKLQRDRDKIEESIYYYRKRNEYLRARYDSTQEMVRAMVPVYNAVGNANYNRGIIFNGVFRRYEKINEEIRGKKAAKREYIEKREAIVRHRRKNEKDKKEFDARRKNPKEKEPQQEVLVYRTEILPKPGGKGLDDGDNKQI